MKTATMGSRGSGRYVVALGALALGLLAAGCAEECVDQYDCIRDKGRPSEGRRYVCESSRCVERDIVGAGTDAGTDAGVACTDLPHDSKLGTLQLQPGYAAAESATLPEGIGAVTAIQSGTGFTLYGLRDADKSLYSLGTWPDITLGAAPLRSVISEADLPETTYLSSFLTNDGTRLLAGYTKPGSFTNTPGSVLVYDTASPDKSTSVSANGNFSAAGLSGAFLINGQGIQGSAEGGNGIYALKTDTASLQGSKLATFPESLTYSGYTVVTSNNIAVLGHAVPDTSTSDPYDTLNILDAVAPATYSPALSDGTTLTLDGTTALELYSGGGLFSAAGFGEGVALHRGSFDASYNPRTHDVSRIALTVGGFDPKVVTAGELEPVLTTQDTCTNVGVMAAMGADLLVGVSDKNGSRLVRLQKQWP